MCSGVYMLRETMPLLNMTLSYRTTNEGITKRRYQSHCSVIQSYCLLPFLPACNNSTVRQYHQFIVCPPVVPWRSVTPAERLFDFDCPLRYTSCCKSPESMRSSEVQSSCLDVLQTRSPVTGRCNCKVKWQTTQSHGQAVLFRLIHA